MVGIEKLKDKKKDVNSESISSNIPEEIKKVKILVKSKITKAVIRQIKNGQSNGFRKTSI